MKSIDELIAEFCPDGVEYKPLREVCKRITDGMHNLPNDISQEGDYPIISAENVSNGTIDMVSRKYVSSKTFEKENTRTDIKQGDVLLTIVGAIGRTAVVRSNQGFLCQRSLCVLKPRLHIVDSRFIAHVLESCPYQAYMNQRARGAAQKGLYLEQVSQIQIPLPPLVVQKEIVRILDGFTGLINELENELAARRKQYEQYRDRILDHGDSDSYCCLGEVVLSLNTGLNPRQFFKLNTNDATNYYVTIREIHDGKIVFSDKTDKINDTALSLCNNRSNLEVGDVLFSGTGTIGETAVIDEPPTNWNIKEGVYAVKPDSSKVLSRYLHYAFMCSSVRKAYGTRIFGGTVKSISMKDLLKIKIPLPPLAEQKRIVEILDKFDDLCNDATAGLAAEIAARKKQYEYYRDKLLTFKKAS